MPQYKVANWTWTWHESCFNKAIYVNAPKGLSFVFVNWFRAVVRDSVDFSFFFKHTPSSENFEQVISMKLYIYMINISLLELKIFCRLYSATLTKENISRKRKVIYYWNDNTCFRVEPGNSNGLLSLAIMRNSKRAPAREKPDFRATRTHDAGAA